MTPEQAYSEEDTQRILRAYKEWLPRVLEGDRFPNIEFFEAPKYADFDYEVYYDGEFDHFIEVKKRNCVLGRYKSTKVPIRKHGTAQHFKEAYDINTYFVCGYDDCVGVLKLWEEPDEDTTMVARYDRGNDTDLYGMYKVTRFRKI